MFRRQRSITVGVVLALALLLVLGIVAHASDKPSLTILYMRHWVPEANETVKQRAQEWAAANNATINFEEIAEKDFDYKIAVAVENKTGPDLALFRTSTPILFQDALVDMTDIAMKLQGEFGDFYPANKAQSFAGGRYVAIPWYTVFPTLMYRTDMFEEAGLGVPETYDDFVAAAKKLTKPAKGIFGFGTAYSRSRDAVLFVQSVLWAFGSKLADQDGKTILFDSPETLAGLRFLVSLYKEHRVMPPGVTGWDDSSNNNAWLAGQLAMTTNAASIYYQAKTNNPALAQVTGHARWPAGPNGRPVMMDTYSLAVLKYTKYPELAKSLLAHICSGDGYRRFYKAGQGFQSPTMPVFEDMDVFQDPKISPIIAMLPEGRVSGWPGPATRAAAEVEAQGIMVDMVQRVIVDGITPEAALKEATRRIEDIYAKYN